MHSFYEKLVLHMFGEIRDLMSTCFAQLETNFKNTEQVTIHGYSSFRKISIFQREQLVVVLFLFPTTFPINPIFK